MPLRLPLLCLLSALALPLAAPQPVLSAPAGGIYLAQALDADQQITNAVYLNQEGYDLFQKGQPQAALETFRKALAIFQQYGARGGEAKSLGYIGEVYHYSLGQYEQARSYYQQALELWRQQGIRSEEWPALYALGTLHRDQDQYEQALDLFQQALAIVRDVGDRTSEGYRLDDIATLYFKLGQYERATEFYQQALQVYQQNLSYIDIAATYSNLGVMATNQGQYAQAIRFYEQALDLYNTRVLTYQGAKATTLNNLASLYYSLGLYKQAITTSQQALKIFARIEAGNREAVSQITLLYTQLGNIKPLEFRPRTVAQRAGTGSFSLVGLVDVGKGTTLNNIGRIYSSAGEFKQALTAHQDALKTYREARDRAGMAIALNDLGQVSVNLNQFDQARTYYQQALTAYQEARDRTGEGVVLSNLGQLAALQGNNEQALKLYQQALAIHREVKDRPNESITLKNIGALLIRPGQLKTAEQNFRQAIAVLESLRPGLTDANKVSLFDTQLPSYKLLQKVLIAQNQPEAALEVAERSRARAFVELLSQRLASKPEPAVSPLSVAQIRQLAQSQALTLVEYSMVDTDRSAEKQLLIWVVQPSGTITLRQVPLTQSIQALVATSRLSIGVEGRGLSFSENTAVVEAAAAQLPRQQLQNPQLQTLHQLLIQPIADLLPPDPEAPVVFIPEGEIFLAPFAALQDAQGRYLMERHTIVTAPAIQVLQLTQEQRDRLQQDPTQQEMLVVGNPTMPSLATRVGEPPRQLATLPGAEAEAQAIATLFRTQAVTGHEATKATVLQRMAQARIIHLATHGLLDSFKGTGMPGAIALAPSGDDNGLLTSGEIANLTLKAEMVVLSACDTGRGDIRGDGVVGLSRSLMVAGVPTVLVSLWKVPDEPTALLMTEFYRTLQAEQQAAWRQRSRPGLAQRLKAEMGLANPRLPKTPARSLAANSPRMLKARALRQAMLKTLKAYPDPQAWAAFVLIGVGG